MPNILIEDLIANKIEMRGPSWGTIDWTLDWKEIRPQRLRVYFKSSILTKGSCSDGNLSGKTKCVAEAMFQDTVSSGSLGVLLLHTEYTLAPPRVAAARCERWTMSSLMETLVYRQREHLPRDRIFGVADEFNTRVHFPLYHQRQDDLRGGIVFKYGCYGRNNAGTLLA